MRTRWAALMGGTSFAFMLQYIDLALLSRWSLDSHGTVSQQPGNTQRWEFESPEKATLKRQETANEAVETSELSRKHVTTFWGRLRFGWDFMWAFRHLNTKDDVKNVPPFLKRNQDYTPARG